ncbi:MAG TPA: hypothetical protein VMG12_42480, partial [Polyangiaceae bacterium]|nr:hypothetical protein [Polyangiaceae bacterium]
MPSIRPHRPAALSFFVLAASAGCGAASDDAPIPRSNADTNMYEGPPFYEQPDQTVMDPGMPAAGGTGGDFVDDAEEPEGGGVEISDACVIDKGEAELVRQPVDIILLLDNSGSMEDELEAVEANINQNFADILNGSDVDYHLILISRHRQEPRDESEEASTSICVTTPLSGLASCDEAEQPVFTARFYQYSTKLEST